MRPTFGTAGVRASPGVPDPELGFRPVFRERVPRPESATMGGEAAGAGEATGVAGDAVKGDEAGSGGEPGEPGVKPLRCAAR